MLIGNNLRTLIKQEKAKSLKSNYLAFYLVPRPDIAPRKQSVPKRS